MLTKYVPKITDYRNEVVFLLGAAATFLWAVIEIVNGIDLDSIDSYVAAVPLLLAAVQRQFAYGPETVKRDYVER